MLPDDQVDGGNAVFTGHRSVLEVIVGSDCMKLDTAPGTPNFFFSVKLCVLARTVSRVNTVWNLKDILGIRECSPSRNKPKSMICFQVGSLKQKGFSSKKAVPSLG